MEILQFLLLFIALLMLCARYVKKQERKPLICKCKRGKLIKYEGSEYGKGFSCINKKGVRMQVKNVYKCKSCERITIEIN